MKPPALPSNESQRQAAVTALSLPDGMLEGSLNRVTRLLASALDVPVTTFTIIDHDTQFFTATQGLAMQEVPRAHSFCGHTILQDEILVVENAAEHSNFCDNPLVVDEPRIMFYAGIPVRSPEGHKLGSLCFIDRQPRQLTEVMTQCLYDARAILEDELLLRSQSIRDPLTWTYNRGHFDDILAREWARARRSGSPLGLILVDIDHFKKYNDTWGHPQGDICLQQVAQVLQSEAKRAGDIVFRLGGEEFAVLVPETSETGTGELAERIRQGVHAQAIPHPGLTPSGNVTLSLGAVTGRPADARPASSEALLEQADQFLYQAKHAGRNQVVWGEGQP